MLMEQMLQPLQLRRRQQHKRRVDRDGTDADDAERNEVGKREERGVELRWLIAAPTFTPIHNATTPPIHITLK